MIILRNKLFSEENNKNKDEDKKREKDETKAAIAGIGAAGILATTKPGRLTGKVTRYHNTEKKNVKSILKEGLKAKYSEDPNNLTNRVVRDVDMSKKRGLVYTAKRRFDAYNIGVARELTKKGFAAILGPMPDDYIRALKNNKTLKLEFDYDELKGNPRIENPELRGAKNWREFNEKIPQDPLNAYLSYKSLGKGTHIFKGDIDPKHIVGGKGYKKRTLEQVKKYIKNNPKRFGKEAAKVGTGLIIGSYAVKKAIDSRKKNKEKQKEDKNDNT